MDQKIILEKKGQIFIQYDTKVISNRTIATFEGIAHKKRERKSGTHLISFKTNRIFFLLFNKKNEDVRPDVYTAFKLMMNNGCQMMEKHSKCTMIVFFPSAIYFNYEDAYLNLVHRNQL